MPSRCSTSPLSSSSRSPRGLAGSSERNIGFRSSWYVRFGQAASIPANHLYADFLGHLDPSPCLHSWPRYDLSIDIHVTAVIDDIPGQLIALRLLIGLFEAGFYPTCVFYLSTFYTRFDLGVRIGLFYGQYVVAGAFSGAIGAFITRPNYLFCL